MLHIRSRYSCNWSGLGSATDRASITEQLKKYQYAANQEEQQRKPSEGAGKNKMNKGWDYSQISLKGRDKAGSHKFKKVGHALGIRRIKYLVK